MDGYDTAEVCLNGHVTTSSVQISPELGGPHCPECGETTIRKCPVCNQSIRGYYHVDGVMSLAEYHPPKFCYTCGTAFPWKSRAIAAIGDLAEEIDLDTSEKAQLKQAADDLTKDTPQTEVAAVKFRRLVKKAGSLIGPSIERTLTTVATEAAKKLIGL